MWEVLRIIIVGVAGAMGFLVVRWMIQGGHGKLWRYVVGKERCNACGGTVWELPGDECPHGFHYENI